MRKQLILLALTALLSNCTWYTTPTGTSAFRRACRYPKIAQIIGNEFRSYQGRDCIVYFCDLDLNGKVDVHLLYPILRYTEDDFMARSRFPYVFIWMGKDGEPYAQQFDLTADGSIDSVSGNVAQLNRVLDQLEQR